MAGQTSLSQRRTSLTPPAADAQASSPKKQPPLVPPKAHGNRFASLACGALLVVALVLIGLQRRHLYHDILLREGRGEDALRFLVDASRPAAATSARYLCWTVDTTDDREFFTLSFRERKLQFLARELSRAAPTPGYCRVGGTGSDFLTYLSNNTNGCTPGGPWENPGPPRAKPSGKVKGYYQGGEMCLTQEHLDDLIAFWIASEAPVIFGLNAEHRLPAAAAEAAEGGGGPGGASARPRYDVRNAVELLTYCEAKGFRFAGLQLGNEVNLELSAAEAAEDFLALQEAVDGLFPDGGGPFLVGPDTHSLHRGGAASKYEQRIVDYLRDFTREALQRGVRLEGVGHHEYIQVTVPGAFLPLPEEDMGAIGGSWRPESDPPMTDPRALSRSATIARDCVEAVKDGAAQAGKCAPGTWASELGPHNAGHPPCISGGRWANFGSTLWFLDTLGAKARAGYATVCRQDFIGADYGLLDCKTHDPLPDYWGALLWLRLMGRRALRVDAVVAELAAGDSGRSGTAKGPERRRRLRPKAPPKERAAIDEMRDRASKEAMAKGEVGPGVEVGRGEGYGAGEGAEGSEESALRVYAHCDAVGKGVVFLAINVADDDRVFRMAAPLRLGATYESFALTAEDLGSSIVRLNGSPLRVIDWGDGFRYEMPHKKLEGVAVRGRPAAAFGHAAAGIVVGARSAKFIRFPGAHLAACEAALPREDADGCPRDRA